MTSVAKKIHKYDVRMFLFEELTLFESPGNGRTVNSMKSQG